MMQSTSRSRVPRRRRIHELRDAQRNVDAHLRQADLPAEG